MKTIKEKLMHILIKEKVSDIELLLKNTITKKKNS